MDWLGQKKLVTFYPRQDFLPHVHIFVWSYYKTDEVKLSTVLLCKVKQPSFVVGHFSYIVNVFDYNNSSSKCQLSFYVYKKGY